MLNKEAVSRRKFLKGATTAAAAGPLILSSYARSANGQTSANERIQVGCIGVGGRGNADMRGTMNAGIKDARVIALADVRYQNLTNTQNAVNKFYEQRVGKGNYRICEAHRDFRELIARDDIDAVQVTTPDHWHVPVAMAAVKAGKDVFVEKPLGMSVRDGRALCDAVERYGRVFQFGTQQRSDARFRQACELVRNGRIGELKTIRVGSPASGNHAVEPPAPVPEGFDYDLWLGPAPKEPYTEHRCFTPQWYFISDYALGFIAGWGIHHVDIAQWGNDTDRSGPIEYEGTGVFPEDGMCDTATAWRLECKYANGVTMIYADNQKEKQGVVFEGTEGWVYVKRGLIDANPKSLLTSEIKPDETHLYKSNDHMRNFLDCIKSRKETICPVEVAQRSDTICHVSDIALRLRRKVKWNPETESFVDDAEADRYLTRAMREPWRL